MTLIHSRCAAVLLAVLLQAMAAQSRAVSPACPDLSALQPTLPAASPRSMSQLAADRLVAEAQALMSSSVSDAILAEAISRYEEALRVYPRHASAHLLLARAHMLSQRYLSVPRATAHSRAFENLAKGRALEPANIEGLHLLADEAFLRTLDYSCAKRIYEVALRLDPGNARTHRLHSDLLSGMGDFPLAFEHADRALTLSEGAMRRNIQLNQGRPRYMAGQYDWVIEHYATYLAANPGATLAHFYRSLAFGAKGDAAQALVEAKRATPKAPAGDAGGIAMLAMAYAKAGRESEARELLRELLGRHARRENVVEYRIAAVYEALGERDLALDWLNREIEDRNGIGSWLLWLKQDPAWNAMRRDPRFKDIERRSGW